MRGNEPGRRARRPTLCALAAVAVAAAALAACRPTGSAGEGSGGQPASGTFVVAFVGDLSGPGAAEGSTLRNAAQLAVEEAAAGAPGGLTLVLKDFDTGGNPAQAASQAAAAAGDASVLGVVATPGAAAAVAAVAAGAGLPVVSPAAPEGAAGPPLRFVGPSQEAAARALAAHVASGLQAGRAALYQAGPGGARAEAIRGALAAAGVEVVLDTAVDPAADAHPDVVAATRALVPAPEALVYAGPPATAGRLARQLTAAGVRARLVGDGGLLAAGFLQAAGQAAAAGTQALCACALPGGSEAASGPAAEFSAAFTARWGQAPGRLAAEAYAAARLVATAVVAGQTRRADLAAHLASIDVVEVAGRRVHLDGGGELTLYEVRDGQFAAVGTVGSGS